MNRKLERRDATGNRMVQAFAFDLKAVDEGGMIEGYGSVFGEKDTYNDIVAKGAFSASLKAHKSAGTMPAMLWQHDPGEPIGVWMDMEEDDRGLRVRGQIVMETERGKAAYALLKRGALRGLSIGFMAKSWQYDRDTEIRTVIEIDLWEVSLVTFPANGKALVDGVKAAIDTMGGPKDAEKTLREAGFSKSDATAFVSRVLRMGEERREAANALAEASRAAQRLLENLTRS